MMEEIKNKTNFVEIFSSKGRSKILKLLVLENEMNISKIVSKSGLNHSNVQRHLEFLEKINFIQQKRFGRIRIYRYKNENLKANALKNLILFWENINE